MPSNETKIGQVTHFYDHLGVGIVKLAKPLKVGDKIHIKGHTSDFAQTIESIQLNHKEIDSAKKGDEVGVKVSDKVREGDEVYCVSE